MSPMSGRKAVSFLLSSGICILCSFAAGLSLAQSQDEVTGGEVIVEPATLRSLGFEWPIEGDTDRDAVAWIEYRANDESAWRSGLPLLRLHGERTVFWDSLDYTAPNMFAGSLLNLTPDTEYSVRLTLTDPDGAHGITEEESGSDVFSLQTHAEKRGDAYVLNGTKKFVSLAPVADIAQPPVATVERGFQYLRPDCWRLLRR